MVLAATLGVMHEEFLIGVDEAGRGPLAGPVAVGAVLVPLGFDVLKEFPGVRDSKQLSGQKREIIFESVLRRASRGDMRFMVCFSDHHMIDRKGISHAVATALERGVRELSAAPHAFVLLDGLLKAPQEYAQRTIIHGDSLVPLIGLASILAKVTRDRTMEQLSALYPEYGFEQHKGYGTHEHIRAIRHHGLSAVHRKSYCKNLKYHLTVG